jgi:type IV secretion system protein VirB1
MLPVDFAVLAQQCAPDVHPATLQALVKTESGFNPYAIGVVGGKLERQPRNLDEAVATARSLEAGGWNYSMGLGQVNRSNLARYRLNTTSVFDPCANLRAGASILSDCYSRAAAVNGAGQAALLAAISCYYSGNFTRGFAADAGSKTSYVQRVSANVELLPVTTSQPVKAIPVVPALPGAKVVQQGTRTLPTSPAPTVQDGSDSVKVEPRSRASWDIFGDF